jgi:hypothetical protein
MRTRASHHTGDLRALATTTYSAYDHLPERLRALKLWQVQLREIVGNHKPRGLRW